MSEHTIQVQITDKVSDETISFDELKILYETLFGEKTILKFNIRIVDSKENSSNNSFSIKKKTSFSTAELKQTLIKLRKLNTSIALVFANACLDSNISFANVGEIPQETKL